MLNVKVKAKPDGSHDVSLGKLTVNTKKLTATDVLVALTSIPPGTKAGDVRYFCWRLLDYCDGFEHKQPKPKRTAKCRVKR